MGWRWGEMAAASCASSAAAQTHSCVCLRTQLCAPLSPSTAPSPRCRHTHHEGQVEHHDAAVAVAAVRDVALQRVAGGARVHGDEAVAGAQELLGGRGRMEGGAACSVVVGVQRCVPGREGLAGLKREGFNSIKHPPSHLVDTDDGVLGVLDNALEPDLAPAGARRGVDQQPERRRQGPQVWQHVALQQARAAAGEVSCAGPLPYHWGTRGHAAGSERLSAACDARRTSS